VPVLNVLRRVVFRIYGTPIYIVLSLIMARPALSSPCYCVPVINILTYPVSLLIELRLDSL
jgi:hypothetical protein